MKNTFILSCLFFFLVLQSQAQSWQRLNGPAGGMVWRVVKLGNKLFAGTIHGLYKSTDLGISWQLDTSGIPAHVLIRDLEVKNNTIVAATSNGIYTSPNGGSSWVTGISPTTDPMLYTTYLTKNDSIFQCQDINLRNYKSVDGIRWVRIGSSNRIGRNGNSLLYADGINLKRSTDNGFSWATIYSAQGGYTCIDGDGSLLLVSTDQQGILRSTDNGNTFSHVSNGLPPVGICQANAFAFKGDTVYASILDTVHRIYYSTDRGINWAQLNPGTRPAAHAFSFYRDHDIMLSCSTYGLFRSTDQGFHWNYNANLGINNATISDMILHENRIYAVTEKESFGFYASRDSGRTWNIPSNSPAGSNGHCIAAIAATLITFSDNNIRRSTDYGISWSTVQNNDLVNTECLFKIQNRFFAGTYFNGLWRSDDSGSTWTVVFGNNTAVFCFTSKGAHHFIGTNNGTVKRSNDNGATWINLSAGLPPTSDIVALTASSTYLFAIARSSGLSTVYRSADDGLTWQQAATGLPPALFMSIAAKGDTIVAGTDRAGANLDNNFLYRSANNGNNWQDFTQGMYMVADIKCLRYINGDLYAGTETGGLWKWDGTAGQGPSGISRRNKQELIAVLSPNPVTSKATLVVTVDKQTQSNITLTNIMGTVLKQWQISGAGVMEKEIDLEELPGGLYLLNIQNSFAKKTLRFVKK